MKFQQHNLQNIKTIVSEQTGVPMGKTHRSYFAVRRAAVIAAAIGLLTITAVAAELFSSLAGDEVKFASTYEGNGIVTIEVENLSSKQLTFQETLKVKQFYGNQEIEPHGQVRFSGTTVEPESSGILQVDLSDAYDMELLEQELTDDWYYLVLTNNRFAFGQDWMCTVEFAPMVHKEPPVQLPLENGSEPAMETVSFASLQPYVERAQKENMSIQADRAAFVEAYYRDVENALAQAEGSILPAVDPSETGVQIQEDFLYLDLKTGGFFPEEGYLMSFCKVSSVDGFFIPVGREEDSALVMEALLPQHAGDSRDGGTAIPLAYFMAYDAEASRDPDACAFIRGQLIPFSALAGYEVYRDERHAIYNVTPLFYTGLDAYLDPIRSRVGPTYLDDEVLSCLRNNAAYYQEMTQEDLVKVGTGVQ